MENKENAEKKTPWFVQDEADNTIRLVGAMVIFALGMVGVFLLEKSGVNDVGEGRKYVTPELLHSLFAFIAGWVSGTSMGKKTRGDPNGAPGGKP